MANAVISSGVSIVFLSPVLVFGDDLIASRFLSLLELAVQTEIRIFFWAGVGKDAQMIVLCPPNAVTVT